MKFTNLLSKILQEKIVYAHCDVPCGIYDPYCAQVAAHTVLRMTQMIEEVSASSKEPPFEERKKVISQISRLTNVKEEHAEIVKQEVRTIWGDYVKEENYKDLPLLHKKVFDIMHLASKARQTVDVKSAENLLAAVQEFSEIFYKSKGLKVVRIPSGYPTGGGIVSHK